MNTVDALKSLYKTLAGKNYGGEPNPTDAEMIAAIAADAQPGGGGGGSDTDQIKRDLDDLKEDVTAMQNGLPGMISDEMDDKFGRAIGDNVTDWLNDHVDPVGSAVVVDDTLSIEGAAADAKKTGDEISSLKEDISDITENSISLDYSVKFDSSILGIDGYVNSATGETQGSATWKRSDMISVDGWKFLYLVMPTFPTVNAGGMAFYDVNKSFISGVAGRVTGNASCEVRYIEIPSNAVWAKFSLRAADLPSFFLYYGSKTSSVYSEVYLQSDIVKGFKWEAGTLDGNGSELSIRGFYRSEYIDVIPGSEIAITVGSNAVFVFEYSGSVFMRTSGSTGGKKYTSDTVDTLRPNTTSIRLVTRLDPVDEASKIDIINNISVLGYASITKALRNRVSSIENANESLCMGVQMFEKIGVISDSISVGWALDKNGNNSRRNTGISWVQQMARRLGCTAYNLGASGVDPIEWFQSDYEFYQYCLPQYNSVGACDLYIIGLGLNGGNLGSIADINQSDYTQNGATFYGQYARIIQMINAEHPNAIVMCLTEPTTRISTYDQAVRDICGLSYINAELVDLENDYFDLFNTPEILAEHQPDGLHFTPYGYSLLANAMMVALNDYISKNPATFKYVGVATV